ncbi:TonB-dependent receptor [Formosa agariphila KMM 3901]|uniref:TonB-dependent receptor n=1 Tax=Formosa agariphila (strain DSM 15362 / KCTC 12365 / LMG 23005 / KMM 3901 / M-2Alg 35-1) TaxID=1347342 RepID=T2KNZ4_FORAG|nr:SusC/RagA family TonB-linked outer membrane protein [Formosa agariphila]CDF80183.1 TonB-dependent receptor [Formosa agariphila KMM 3901]
MKRSIFIFALLFFNVAAFAYAQKINLKKGKVPLHEALKEVREQANVELFYSNKGLDLNRLVEANFYNVDFEDAISKLIGKNFELKNQGNQLYLIVPAKTVQQDILTVRGVVQNQKGEKLPGATVKVKGTLNGVSTNIEGKFVIEVPVESGITSKLVVSFVGYKNSELTIGENTNLLVTLEEDINSLDEVTVVAYGERNQKELINSVASVKADAIKDMPAANLENLMQGQMAGVAVVNQSGAPGGTGSIVSIRGQNSLRVTGPDGTVLNDGSPLYVVDGIPIISENNTDLSVSGLADIDPSTIESMEVLKDASATAMYGSRANNGVILITTKKGKTGKAEIKANVSTGYSILPKTPVQTLGNAERQFAIKFIKGATTAYYDFATRTYIVPQSYEDSWNKYGTFDWFWGNGVRNGAYQPAVQDSLNSYYNNNSNWWDYFFQTGKTTNVNLQVNGGTELFRYNVSAGHYKEEGIMPGSAFKRYNLTANLDLNPRKNLSITSTNYFAYTNRGIGGSSNNGAAYMVGSPISVSSLSSIDNPIAIEQANRIADTEQKNNTYRLRSGLRIGLDLAPGLKFTSSPAVDLSLATSNIFIPSYLDDQYGLSKVSAYNTMGVMLNWENLLNYNKTFNEKHNFELLLGQGYTSRINNASIGYGSGMSSNDIHYVPQIPASNAVIEQNGVSIFTRNYSSTYSKTVLLSYFGRVAYNFNEKYLFEGTIRRDGSSTFGDGKKWGTFPSLAAGWNFSSENFMNDAWWLSSGKLRASWGVTGIQFNDPYLAQGTVSDASSPYFLNVPGLAPDQVSYDNLNWEESQQYDIGLDVNLFDYRVKIVADYYYKYNKDQIYNAPLPGDVYFKDKTWRNTFSTSNQGIEFAVQADIFRDTEVKWTSSFNIARNYNKFEESYNNRDVDNFILGNPLFGFNVYVQDGFIESEEDIPVYYNVDGSVNLQNQGSSLYPTQVGMKKIKDLNDDGRINELDKVYKGSPLPKATGGFNNRITWKNFDLNFLFTYTLSKSLINAVPYSSYLNSRDPSVGPLLLDVNNAEFWSQQGFDNANGDYNPMFPSANLGYSPQADPMVDTNIETVNYLRLKRLNISYNFNQDWMKNIGLESTRVFITAENLFLITNYSGLDPEAVNITGVDNLDSYPLPRVFTLGCSINF